MRGLWQDLRFGARLLRVNPGFAVVAVLSLALGIGANTAIFQLIDAVRLRTLPVKDPQQLATVRIIDRQWSSGSFNGNYAQLTYPLWQQIRQRQEGFSSIGAFGEDSFNLATGGEVHNARGLWVSGDFFSTLGVQPFIGRMISNSDDQSGCAGGVDLSYAFWQHQYGGEASALGKDITLEGHAFPIIGVTSPRFNGVSVGESFDVAVPICAEAIIRGEYSRLNGRKDWWLAAIGRLKPGWSVEKATSQLKVISPQMLQETIPPSYDSEGVKHYLAYKFGAFPADTGLSELRRQSSAPLWLLLGISGLVLLIACANLANLMLARANSRQREISVRLALGASRGRLIRQLLVESLLLAFLGALFGALLADQLSGALVAMITTPNNPTFLDLGVDWRVLGFTMGLAVLTVVFFGLAPALRATTAEPNAVLKTGRGMTASRERHGFRRSLVSTQVALSVVLLVAALLFVRSFRNLMTVDAGFRQDGAIVTYVDFTKLKLPAERRQDFKRDLLERLRGVPGVETIAGARLVPIGGSFWNDSVTGKTNADEKGVAWENFISPNYFRTLETPLVEGRDFDSNDTATSPAVAIVNQAFVNKYLGTNPIGEQFRLWTEPGKPERIYQVVGVVKNSKYQDMREDFSPIAYFPMAQDNHPDPWSAIVIRSTEPPAMVIPAVKDAVAGVNPEIDIDFRLLRTQIRETLVQDQLMATLSGFFGLLAVVLAAIGLYGVISYMVVQRTNEVGIRMAVGAQRSDVLKLMLHEAGIVVLIGLIVGTGLAFFAAKTTASLLFGLKPRDPITYLFAMVIIAVVAALASFLPAQRASKLDPMVALRYE
jgi:predicted permease